MRVFCAKIDGLTEEIRQENKNLLTEERIARIERFRHEGDKQRGFGAGLLLEYGLRLYGYTQRQISMERNEAGKYRILGIEGLCFNLSHSGDYVAAVFDESEVGIDIERQREAKLQVARRFFTEEEYRDIRQQNSRELQEKMFTRIWTRKESYVKAIGLGLKKDLRSFDTRSDELKEMGGDFPKYYFRTYEGKDSYTISVCAKTQNFPDKIEYIDLMGV